MSDAKRDENFVTAALAIDDTTGITTPILMDPVTDRILIVNAAVSSGGTLQAGDAKRDQNSVTTLLGVDDVTGELVPIATDDNGNLLADFA